MAAAITGSILQPKGRNKASDNCIHIGQPLSIFKIGDEGVAVVERGSQIAGSCPPAYATV